MCTLSAYTCTFLICLKWHKSSWLIPTPTWSPRSHEKAVYHYELGPLEQWQVFKSFGKCLLIFQKLRGFFSVVIKIWLFPRLDEHAINWIVFLIEEDSIYPHSNNKTLSLILTCIDPMSTRQSYTIWKILLDMTDHWDSNDFFFFFQHELSFLVLLCFWLALL